MNLRWKQWPPLAWIFLLLIVASVSNALGWWHVNWQLATDSMYATPSPEHWLGTNRLGQDTLARLIQSLMNALQVGLLVGACATLLGLALGVIAGLWVDSFADAMIQGLIGAGEALPVYLLAAAFSSGFDGSLLWVCVALVISFATGTARVVRARVVELRETEFIVTARALGVPDWRIAWAHIPSAILPMVLFQAYLSVVSAIKVEAVLGFLGLVAADHMGVGVLLAESAQDLVGGRIVTPIATCLAFFLLVLLIHTLAEQVADRISGTWRFHGA